MSLTARTLDTLGMGFIPMPSPDALAEARAALIAQGKGWTDRFNRAVKKIARDYSALGALATTA